MASFYKGEHEDDGDDDDSICPPSVFWEDLWNAVHITSQVTHGSNYMLANNRTESN